MMRSSHCQLPLLVIIFSSTHHIISYTKTNLKANQFIMASQKSGMYHVRIRCAEIATTMKPTPKPSTSPTQRPTTTAAPTSSPSPRPTTSYPTQKPTSKPTSRPTLKPTPKPSTSP
eukprot:327221_1